MAKVSKTTSVRTSGKGTTTHQAKPMAVPSKTTTRMQGAEDASEDASEKQPASTVKQQTEHVRDKPEENAPTPTQTDETGPSVSSRM